MLDSEHPVVFVVDTGVSLDHLIACVDHGSSWMLRKLSGNFGIPH